MFSSPLLGLCPCDKTVAEDSCETARSRPPRLLVLRCRDPLRGVSLLAPVLLSSVLGSGSIDARDCYYFSGLSSKFPSAAHQSNARQRAKRTICPGLAATLAGPHWLSVVMPWIIASAI